jgi:hypothetical protein
MVLVREATTGPADVGHSNRLQRRHNIIADAARVSDFGIGTNPDAFINSVAQMLGELAKDVAINLGTGFGEIDRKFDFALGYC